MKRHGDGRFRGNRSAKQVTDAMLIALWVERETIRLKRMGMHSFDTIAGLLTRVGCGEHIANVRPPEGVTFPDGYRISKMGCCKAFRRRMEREPNLEAEEHRRLDTERCEDMYFALQPGALKGDPRSIDSAVRVLSHKAEINGLKSPARVEITGKDGGPMSVKTFRKLCEEAEKTAETEAEKEEGEKGGSENQ